MLIYKTLMEKEENVGLSQTEAEKLLRLPKKVVFKDKKVDIVVLDFKESDDIRWNLSGYDDIGNECSFLLRIQRSSKIRIKVSLHHQELDSNFCLVRVDFNGSYHTNPLEVTESVPMKMKKYAGCVLKGNHVHYHVEGYKSAAWALPIEEDDFVIKELEFSDYNATIRKILNELSKVINLETKIMYASTLNM